MLRWLEKKDAEQGGQKNGTPLIFYLLMQDATNPAFVALGELYKSIDRQHGGDLRKMLLIWLNQEAPPPPRSMDVELHTSWWVRYSLETFALVGHLTAQVVMRIVYKVNSMPCLLWLPAATAFFKGDGSPAHVDSIRRVQKTPRCCQEEAAKKTFGLVQAESRRRRVMFQESLEQASLKAWQEGPLAEGLNGSAHDAIQLSMRLERDFAGLRRLNLFEHLSYSVLSTMKVVNNWVIDHKAMGGKVPGVLTDQDMFQIPHLRLVRQSRRLNLKAIKCAPPWPWGLYWQSVCAEWRSMMGVKPVAITARLKTRSRITHIHVKGAWIAWSNFAATRRHQWNTDRLLRRHWCGYARRLSEESENALSLNARKRKIQDVYADMNKHRALEDSETIWGAGSRDTPIRIDIMKEVAEQLHQGHGSRQLAPDHPMYHGLPGATRAARFAQEERRRSMYITDPRQEKGKLPRIDVDKVCDVKHPGVCAHIHREVFEHVEHIQANLNRLFSMCERQGCSGRMLRFKLRYEIEEQQEIDEVDVVLLDIRLAQPRVQMVARTCRQAGPQGQTGQLHTFIEKVELGDGTCYMAADSIGMVLAEAIRRQTKEWDVAIDNLHHVTFQEVLMAPEMYHNDMFKWMPFDSRNFRWRLPLPMFKETDVVELYPAIIDPSSVKLKKRTAAQETTRNAKDGLLGESDKNFGTSTTFQEREALLKQMLRKWTL